MNLGELILALKPLLEDPSAHGPEIVDLLDRHASLSEFEVARFYVSRAVTPLLHEQARSQDRAERVTAARGALILSRVDAAQHLRRLVKDPDSIVRSHARASLHRLGLDDVALPDTRMDPRRGGGGPQGPGWWNPSGWSFGLYGIRQRRGAPASRNVQLKRTGTGKIAKPKLPELADTAALAKLLGLASARVFTPLLRPGEGPGAPYVAFEIPKASGGTRTIHAPRPALKAVQRPRGVDAVAFSGSSRTGWSIIAQASARSPPVQAELEGTWGDRDRQRRYQGRRRSNRREAHPVMPAKDAHRIGAPRTADVYEAFLAQLQQSTSESMGGDPWDDRTRVTPTISTRAARTVATLVERARDAGHAVLEPHLRAQESPRGAEAFHAADYRSLRRAGGVHRSGERASARFGRAEGTGFEHALELLNQVPYGVGGGALFPGRNRAGTISKGPR